MLNWTPLNLPPAQVTRIDADTQYASHVVNLVVPGFGDRRLSAGDYGYDLADVARRFYRHFKDDYDSIAFVSRQLHLVPYSAFHLNVRNPIAGLGNLPVFDNSVAYGSAGVLRSVEFYPSAPVRGDEHLEPPDRPTVGRLLELVGRGRGRRTHRLPARNPYAPAVSRGSSTRAPCSRRTSAWPQPPTGLPAPSSTRRARPCTTRRRSTAWA